MTKPCPVKSEKRVWGSCYRKLQAKPLIIGIASGSPEEDYNALAAHLKDQVGSFVEIDKDTPFVELSDRIASQDWDIAFTRSPIFSIKAEDNHYIGVAIMFPDQPPYYRGSLYVRSDSPIKSIADINSTTTIALGNPESAPTFQMPIYALYGKSLRLGTGYRPRDVVEMVKTGKADIGAARYGAVKDDPALRIIYVSKAIPRAGVYLSPKLSITDNNRVKEALLNAPLEIQAKANYGSGKIPNYEDKVSNKANIELKLVTQKKQIYLVMVSTQILNQILNNPVNVVDKSVQVKDVKPRPLADGSWEIKITQPNQLSLL